MRKITFTLAILWCLPLEPLFLTGLTFVTFCPGCVFWWSLFFLFSFCGVRKKRRQKRRVRRAKSSISNCLGCWFSSVFLCRREPSSMKTPIISGFAVFSTEQPYACVSLESIFGDGISFFIAIQACPMRRESAPVSI